MNSKRVNILIKTHSKSNRAVHIVKISIKIHIIQGGSQTMGREVASSEVDIQMVVQRITFDVLQYWITCFVQNWWELWSFDALHSCSGIHCVKTVCCSALHWWGHSRLATFPATMTVFHEVGGGRSSCWRRGRLLLSMPTEGAAALACMSAGYVHIYSLL